MVDNEDGIVVDYTVEVGNPADAPQLAPAIACITGRVDRPPRAVTADRGDGEAGVEATLDHLGVRTVVIPRKGQLAPPKAREMLAVSSTSRCVGTELGNGRRSAAELPERDRGGRRYVE